MVTIVALSPALARNGRVTSGTRLSTIKIIKDLAQAEPLWRDLEAADPIATAFQRYDFIAAWQRHIGDRIGAQPCVIVFYDAPGRVAGLLPLVVQKTFGANVASFPCGKHVTFNMPLWRRDFALSAAADIMESLPDLIADADRSIDVLRLTRQPAAWHGVKNPMASLRQQAAVDECPTLLLGDTPHVGKSLRKRLAQKERRLRAATRGLRYTIARNEADVRRLLSAFFMTKPKRLASQGLPNVFAEPGTDEFLRDTTRHGLGDDYPLIEIHALECDDEVIAMFAGVRDSRHLSLMFNSYTTSDHGKHSPGLILIGHIIDHCAEAGCLTFDLGIGADPYKRLFCKDDTTLFDSFLPITPRGRAAALSLSLQAHAKRVVKRSPTATELALWLRRMVIA